MVDSFSDFSLELAKNKFSYSKLKKAGKCGYAFRKRYLEKEETTNEISENSSAVVGTFIHDLIEIMIIHCRDTGHDISKESLTELLAATISERLGVKPLTLNEVDDVMSLQSSTEYMTRRILTYQRDHDCEILTEVAVAIDSSFKPVEYGSSSTFLMGKIDVVMFDKEGNVLVLDHKTGYPHRTAYRNQLHVYEVLTAFGINDIVRKKYGVDVKTVRAGINFIENEQLQWEEIYGVKDVEQQVIPWLVEWVNGITEDIASNKISRGKHCHYCGYRSFCGSRVGKPRKSKTKGKISHTATLGI